MLPCNNLHKESKNTFAHISRRIKQTCAFVLLCACLAITVYAQAAVTVKTGGTKQISLTDNSFLAYLLTGKWTSSDPSICSIQSSYSDGGFNYATVEGVSDGNCYVYLTRSWVTRAGQCESSTHSWEINVTASGSPTVATATPRPVVTATPKPTPMPTSGSVGKIRWKWDSAAATLTITGSGEMPDYDNKSGNSQKKSPPWSCWFSSAKTVKISDSITTVGDSCFYGAYKLKKVVLGKRITSIGDCAFQNCSNLSQINWPQALIQIGENAFMRCGSLHSVDFSNTGIIAIGDSAFRECDLTKILLPPKEPAIGTLTFSDNTNLSSISIPEGYKTVKGFGSCTSLRTVQLPSTLSCIDDEAFFQDSSLQHIDIPAGVTSINRSSFGGSGILEIEIPQLVTSISGYAFKNCTSLRSVRMGRGVERVGGAAFLGCTSLRSISLPSIIADEAFKDCTSLSEVTYLNDSVTIGTDAFNGCSNLNITHWPANLTIERYGLQGSGQKEFRFSGNNLTVRERACPQATNVYVTAKSAKFCVSSFYGCPLLQNVTICMDSGIIDSNAFNSSSVRTVRLQGTMTIYSGAFRNCSMLSEVILPENGTYVSNPNNNMGILGNCPSLKSLVIPDGVTNGRPIIEGVNYLDALYIPASVTNIYYIEKGGSLRVFYTGSSAQWKALTNVYQWSTSDLLHKIGINYINFIGSLPAEEPIVTPSPQPTLAPLVTPIPTPETTPAPTPAPPAETVAEGTTSNEHVNWILTEDGTLTIYSDGTTQSDYMLHGMTDDYADQVTAVNVAGGITTICDIYGYRNLTEVHLPLTVTAISTGALSSCHSLRSVTMPGVVTIGNGAFISCEALTDIAMPSVVSIGDGAFEFCEALTVIEIPDTCEFIGAHAFNYCTALEKIVLSKALTSLSDWTFAGCYALQSIEIPMGVTSIGDYTFDSCRTLTSVTIPASVTHIGEFNFPFDLKELIYTGSDEQWNAMEIEEHNAGLSKHIVAWNKDVRIPVGVEIIKEEAFCGSAIKAVACNTDLQRIERRAFADCENLVYIWIPKDIRYIAPDAFQNSPKTIILCSENSFAHKWAISYGVDYLTGDF